MESKSIDEQDGVTVSGTTNVTTISTMPAEHTVIDEK